MKFRYRLPDKWIPVVSGMAEFANGGTQVSVRLRDKREFHGILVSNSTYVVAARGHQDLPFALEDVEGIFQESEEPRWLGVLGRLERTADMKLILGGPDRGH